VWLKLWRAFLVSPKSWAAAPVLKIDLYLTYKTKNKRRKYYKNKAEVNSE
jgi:hypothetical protein